MIANINYLIGQHCFEHGIPILQVGIGYAETASGQDTVVAYTLPEVEWTAADAWDDVYRRMRAKATGLEVRS